MAGHLGTKRTLARIRSRFYWAHFSDQVKRWVNRCKQCQKRKPPATNNKGKLQSYTTGIPLERIALDLPGPLPVTHQGNKYLLVVTDYFTRFAEAYPVPNIEAKTIAGKI